jgi:hypothetical protein
MIFKDGLVQEKANLVIYWNHLHFYESYYLQILSTV